MLTYRQVLAAAAVIALAVNEDLPHPEHVKTPAGAKWYDQPIGSIIIAKPHPHDLKEHERLVYVGGKPWSVPDQAVVMVPNWVNTSNDADVATTGKIFKLGPPGQAAKLVYISADGQKANELPLSWNLGDWKVLPKGEQKSPVYIGGKLAGWAPPSWKLYSPKAPSLQVTYAKSPDGKWWLFEPGNDEPLHITDPGLMEQSWKDGNLLPMGEPELPQAVHPPAPSPSVPSMLVAVSVNVPHVNGTDVIPATADQLTQAIEVLKNDNSTAVKQPLAKAGHLLKDMDYHAINKAQLKAHPELKVPKGTKTQHVGQVKTSVLHYLAEQHEKLAASQAQQVIAKEAKEATEKAAEHAQEIDSGKMVIGGIPATKEQVQAAVAALEASKATAIKQTLKAKGNPLAAGDYWQVVNSYKAGHTTLSTDKAKGIYVMALKLSLGNWGKAYGWAKPLGDDHPGKPDPELAVLHGAIMSAPTPSLINMGMGYDTTDEALAAALIMATQKFEPRYVEKDNDGKFHLIISPKPPGDAVWWEVSPQHEVTLHNAGAEVKYSPADTLQVFNSGLAQLSAPEEKEPEKQPVPATPSAQDYKKLLEPYPNGSKLYAVTKSQMGVKPKAGDYYVLEPSGQLWWLTQGGTVQVHIHDEGFATTHQVWLDKGILKHVASKGDVTGAVSTPLPAGAPEVAETAGTIPVEIGGKVAAQVPAGSQVYWSTKHGDLPGEVGIKYVKFPDGHWEKVTVHDGLKPYDALYTPADELVANGTLKLEHGWVPEPEAPKFSDSPGWAELDTLLASKPEPAAESIDFKKVSDLLAVALKRSSEKNIPYWVVKNPSGNFGLSTVTPQSGSPGHLWEPHWRVMPDHAIASVLANGGEQPWAVSMVKSLAVNSWPEEPDYGVPKTAAVILGEAKTAAHFNQEPRYVYFIKASGVWTYSGSPPPPHNTASGWWKVDPDGKVTKMQNSVLMDSLPKPESLEEAIGEFKDKNPGKDTYVVWWTGPGGPGWAFDDKKPADNGNYDFGKGWAKVSAAGAVTSYGPGIGPDKVFGVGGVKEQITEEVAKNWEAGSAGGKPLSFKLALALHNITAGSWASNIVYKNEHSAPDTGWLVTASPVASTIQGMDVHANYYKVTADGVTEYLQGTEGAIAQNKLTDGQVLHILQGGITPLTDPLSWHVTDSGAESHLQPEEPVPVYSKAGKLVGHAPAGTVTYKTSTGDPLLKYPDGTWHGVGSIAIGAAYGPAVNWEAQVAAGALVPVGAEPPSALVASDPVSQLKKELKTGTLDPELDDGSKDYVITKAALFAVKKNSNRYAEEVAPGTWLLRIYKPTAAGAHYYEVGWGPPYGDGKFVFTEHVPGETPKEHDPQELLDAAGKYLVTNAVTLPSGTHYGAKKKVFKHGWYYKPGGKSKQALHIGENDAGTVKATYYPANGGPPVVKKYSVAVKLLTEMTEYHEQQKVSTKEPGPPAKKVTSYATGFAAGANYQYKPLDSSVGLGGVSVQPDGSVVYTPPSGSGSVSGTAEQLGKWLKDGTLLDNYGTTVVKPGVQPAAYYLFNGSWKPDKELLQGALQHLETGGIVPSTFDPAQFIGIPYGAQGYYSLLTWLSDKGAVTSQQKYDAVKGLFHELLEVPEASPLQGVTVTYLKGTPPGIKSPLDVFEGNGLGYPKPYAKGIPGNVYSLGVPELNSLIKDISEQYGGSKVVGTHLSGLTKADKQLWLHNWQQGDMQTVFALDAKGGKVSPIHPGAPANTETHHITWAPWAAGETPAGKPVAGNWSDLSVTLPKAEIDNYLIQAGLQHAEYLTWTQKRSWVTMHRQGNQPQVDMLSRTAHESWLNHWPASTEPPQWTDDVKPAKSYDVFLEEKTPAPSWTSTAQVDFLTAHKDDVLPLVAQNHPEWLGQAYGLQPHPGDAAKYFDPTAKDLGYSPAPWNARSDLIQEYLDHLAAVEEAKAKAPKYHATDVSGGVPAAPDGYQHISDQYGWVANWRESTPGLRARDLAVSQLAKLWGVKVPETRIAELDGTEGIAHQVSDALGYWEAATPASFHTMTDRQIADIAREHVFNWAIDNATAHPGTYAQMNDGSVVGTSHDGAFGSWGQWDGLNHAGAADNYAHQMSSLLYEAVRTHQLTKDQADKAYTESIRAARRFSTLSDGRYQEIIQPAFALMVTPPDLDAVTARKNSLDKDFQEMWSRVYKDAHWTLPEIPKEKLPAGLHSGFSEPSFFDHVIASKSFGAPAFFSGPDLDEGNFLVWTELKGDGPDAVRFIRGESAARGEALKELTAWCQAHETEAVSSNAPVPVTPAEVAKQKVTQAGWYNNIIGGAKAVSRHWQDQLWEGKYTKQQLDGLAKAVTEMTARKDEADKVITAGQDSKAYAEFEAKNGLPEANRDAAIYLLGLAAKVYDRKDVNPTGPFAAGDLPDWVMPNYPEKVKALAEPVAPKIKVVRKKAVRELGYTAGEVDSGQHHLLGEDDGELHLHGKTFTYPGEAWHIELPTGEVIECWDDKTTGTPKGQTGRIRFKADPTKGSASLEKIRTQLQEMGLPLEEAAPEDMELLYWRHLAGVLANRQDRVTAPGAAALWADLKNYFDTHHMDWTSNTSQLKDNVRALAEAGIPPAEELELWHKAWAHVTSPDQVDQWVADGKYLPHLKHWDVTSPETPGGKPVWYRFDADPSWLANQKLITHSYQSGNTAGVLMSRTGGGFSTEARLRALGTSITGMSSTSDMSNSYGSAWVFYTRLNKPDSAGNIKISPRVLAETQSYGYDSDNFGNISNRASSAYFNIPQAAAWTGGSNETLVKDGVSLLDDIEQLTVPSEAQRQQIVKELAAHGVTEIRGVPVEQRVVTSMGTGLNPIKSQMQARAPHWFDQPAEVYTAPPSGIITAGGIETEAETAGHVDEPGELAEAVKDAEASPSAEGAAPVETLDKLFYGEHGKSAFGHGSALTASLKVQTNARIADAMPESTEELQEFYNAIGIHVPDEWGADIRERAVAGMLGLWSIDGNHTALAIAIQDEAAKLFGMPPNPVPPPTSGGSIGAGFLPTGLADAQEIEDKYGYIIRSFLKAQYEATQEDFAKAGVDKVTLYRVMKWPAADAPDWSKGLHAGEQIPTAPSRPLSAWSYLIDGPQQDAVWGKGGHEVLVKTTVPRSLLFAYPRSGFGAVRQQEIVTLDSPGEWEVVKAA